MHLFLCFKYSIISEDLNVTYHIVGDVQTIDNYDYLILRSFTWNLKGEGVRNAYLRNDDVVIGKPALSKFYLNYNCN